MPVSYPLEVPTYGVTSISWTNSTASLISRSPFTFQGQSQSYPGAIRFAQITVEDLNRGDAEDWIGFLDSLNGTKGTFLFGDPMAAAPMGVGGGNPTVSTANQTGDTLLVTGAPVNRNRWLRRGDWIQLGTGLNSRLHKVMANVTTSSGGNPSIILWPALRYSPAAGSPVVLNNPKGLFRRTSGSFSYSEDNGCKYSISFDCEEVI